MTFDNIVDHQIQLSNWIYKNLKPTKIIRSDFYNSFQILGIVKKYLPWVTHEELKQAMARCGFYADFTYCDSGYDALIFNVSKISVFYKKQKCAKSVFRKKHSDVVESLLIDLSSHSSKSVETCLNCCK